jgi:hypothetical protein
MTRATLALLGLGFLGLSDGFRPAGVSPRRTVRMHVETAEGERLQVPKVGSPMPDTKPGWFRVPAPGGGHTRFKELQVSRVFDE